MELRRAKVATLMLVASTSAWSQRPAVRRPAPTTIAHPQRVPSYELHVRIDDGYKLFLSAVSPGKTGEISPFDLIALITDLPTGVGKFDKPNTVFPNVVFEARPNIEMIGLWNPITLFLARPTNITVLVPTGIDNGSSIRLNVPWDSPKSDINVKPDPFLLIVKADRSGNLSLNNDPAGTLRDTEPLMKRLKEIFHEREVNGIFRPGTNEIEKSVTIVMPMTQGTVSDLVTIARAVWAPGGAPISLVMEDPLGSPDDRKELLPLPTSPSRKHP
jgi:hypothetical protein